MAPVMAARVGVRRNAVIAAAFVPTSLANLALWLDAGQITGATDGAAVATWQDRSGNARNAVQATAAKQPIYHSTGTLITVNGTPVVSFDGVSSSLSTSGYTLSSAGNTTFVVSYSKVTTPAGRAVAGASSGPNWLIGPFNGKDSLYTGAMIANASSSTTLFGLCSGISSSSGGTLWVNGTLVGSNVNVNVPTFYTIGFLDSPGDFFSGPIAEVVAYDRALTTTERQQVESYLKAKHGTP